MVEQEILTLDQIYKDIDRLNKYKNKCITGYYSKEKELVKL